jgi:hypothetical protein
MQSEQAYLSKTRFPLTNRQNLTLRQQQMVDAVNLDDLRQLQEHGEMNDRQKALLAELEEKQTLR